MYFGHLRTSLPSLYLDAASEVNGFVVLFPFVMFMVYMSVYAVFGLCSIIYVLFCMLYLQFYVVVINISLRNKLTRYSTSEGAKIQAFHR